MSLKLTIGKLWEAWHEYPNCRSALRAFPPGDPILITGTHRSGTTWFAKMLCVPGLWYIHEPFGPYKGAWKEEFSYVADDDQNRDVDALMRRVLAGGFRAALGLRYADHPLMPLRLLRPKFQRIMIKDPLACLLTAYLARSFHLKPLILFRHPAGFVSSVRRLGWPIAKFIRALLACAPLMERHLVKYAAMLEANSTNDDLVSAAVLHGALNRVLWDFIDQGVGRHLLFEELCQRPISHFATIFRDLDLPYSAATRSAHERLCYGEHLPPSAYHPHAVTRNSQAMANSWREQLSKPQVDQIHRVWRQFDIPLYCGDCAWDVSARALRSHEIRS